jgi:hypothetical protein
MSRRKIGAIGPCSVNDEYQRLSSLGDCSRVYSESLFIVAQREVFFRFFFPPPPGAFAEGSWVVGTPTAAFGVPPRVTVGAGVADDRIPVPARGVSGGALSVLVSNA